MYRIIILFLLLPCSIFANGIDSLKNVLETAEDVDKVKTLNELFKSYRNSVPRLAQSYAEAALELSEQLNYEQGIASSLNNLGVIYAHRGDYDLALQVFLRAVRLQEEIGLEEEKAFTFGNIGNLYSRQRRFEKALEFYEQALQVFEARQDSLKLVGILNNMGNAVKESGNEEKALELYSRALVIYEELPDKTIGFDPRVNIGDVYYDRGEYEKALEYYFESLKIEQEYNDIFQQANLLANIGIVYKEMGNYNEALQYQNEALEIARSIDDKPLLILLYKSLSDTYVEAGDLLFAYSNLRLSESLKDSIFNQQNNQRIAELESAYEIERKDKEIQLLQKENDIKALEISNDRIIMTATIIFAILVLILATMIYLRFMQNQKAKMQLEEQNEQIRERNLEIRDQKKIIEDKNNYITEGIEYAKTVQEAILRETNFRKQFPESFIFNKPKDIVSGDFFWHTTRGNEEIIAVLDCTGHGVAGAFMTVIGNSILEQVVIEGNTNDPGEILSMLDLKIMGMLRTRESTHSQHGLDIALCKINRNEGKLTFAGAKRPVLYFKNGELLEVKGTNNHIGDSYFDQKEFEVHVIEIDPGDVFYLFSDGYADQFGGPDNKKYMIRNFKSLLTRIHESSMDEQLDLLEKEMKEWIGNAEQTDDMLILGLKI